MPVDVIDRVFWVQSEPGTDVNEAVSLVYDAMGVPETEELTVNADAATSNELFAFGLIMDTRFVKGISSMIKEYAEFEGQRVGAFMVDQHNAGPAFDLSTILDEDDKTPEPPSFGKGVELVSG